MKKKQAKIRVNYKQLYQDSQVRESKLIHENDTLRVSNRMLGLDKKRSDEILNAVQQVGTSDSAKTFYEEANPVIARYTEDNFAGTNPIKDNINHPTHYKSHPSGIECIEIVRHMNFNRGNAIKYIWRAGQKQDELHDLGKAIWYLKDEIERIKNAR